MAFDCKKSPYKQQNSDNSLTFQSKQNSLISQKLGTLQRSIDPKSLNS